MNQLSLPTVKPKILLSSSLDTSLLMKSNNEKQLDRIPPCDVIPGNLINFDSSLSVYAQKNSKLITNYPTNCSELCDSDTWLKKYGLRANKLTFQHILSMIGFKQMQGNRSIPKCWIIIFFKFCFFIRLFKSVQ